MGSIPKKPVPQGKQNRIATSIYIINIKGRGGSMQHVDWVTVGEKYKVCNFIPGTSPIHAQKKVESNLDHKHGMCIFLVLRTVSFPLKMTLQTLQVSVWVKINIVNNYNLKFMYGFLMIWPKSLDQVRTLLWF